MGMPTLWCTAESARNAACCALSGCARVDTQSPTAGRPAAVSVDRWRHVEDRVGKDK